MCLLPPVFACSKQRVSAKAGRTVTMAFSNLSPPEGTFWVSAPCIYFRTAPIMRCAVWRCRVFFFKLTGWRAGQIVQTGGDERRE